ncbi:DMT family transporter [Pseudomonadota bacterium]
MLSLTALFWGGNTVVGRFAADYVSPFTLSFLRWCIAFALIVLVGGKYVWAQREVYWRCRGLVVITSLMGVAYFNTLQYWALHWTTAIHAGVLNAVMPVAVFSLTWLMGIERASGRQLMGMLAAGLGCLTIVSGGDVRVLVDFEINFGDFLMLLAVAGFALYSVLLRRLPTNLNPIGLLTAQTAIGSLGVAPFFLYELSQGEVIKFSYETLLILVYVGIFPSVLAYLFWIKGVLAAGANTAVLFINLVPVSASVLAVWFIGETFHLYQAIAMALIFFGIYLAVFRAKV